ncbi:MAG: NAD(P)/FAD-dependent oxidoreductase [Acidimicrobiia bacterium]|nr:NAD(P)/FAD-dependent oxidoreductase [Acidimicrobiia bacterium]
MSGSVVVVGGGFGGLGCAHRLAHHDVEVTLVDRNDYHQFQPLLYQLATAQVGVADIARPLRGVFHKAKSVRVVTGEVVAIDPAQHRVELAGGTTLDGDVLVIAAGAQPNFFGTPGAAEHAFPLYSVEDAERLRSRMLGLLDSVDRDPALVDKGALTIVIVGAGATGVEAAGAFAETLKDIVPHAYPGLPVDRAQVVVVDRGDVVLNGFSERAHDYATRRLQADGVDLRLGVGVAEVGSAHVELTDGTELATHLVIWAGGEKAAGVVADAGLPTGRGGRVDVDADLTVPGFVDVYAVGDAANVPGPDGTVLPQLGSVAQQSGRWAAKNILAGFDGEERKPFDYHDKGIMAMIGRNAAVAELGADRHEIHGPLAFAAWLGVHATLLEGSRQKLAALMTWGWDYASKKRPHALVDRPDAYAIDWDDDDTTSAADNQAGD